jgi:hypothetical protein
MLESEEESNIVRRMLSSILLLGFSILVQTFSFSSGIVAAAAEKYK